MEDEEQRQSTAAPDEISVLNIMFQGLFFALSLWDEL